MTAAALTPDYLWKGKPSQLLNLPYIAIAIAVIAFVAFGHGIIWTMSVSALEKVVSSSQLAKIKTYYLLAAAAIALMPLFGILWRLAKTQSISYTLYDERFIERYGVLNRNTNNLELFRVKDIGLTQELFERLLGLGSVVLYTSDISCPKVYLSGIEDASTALELIRERVNFERSRKNVRELDVN